MNDIMQAAANPTPANRRQRKLGRRSAYAAVSAAVGIGSMAAASAVAAPASRSHASKAQAPVALSVFSPDQGSRAGVGVVGFIVDLSLQSRRLKYNHLLSSAGGYKPAFNDPMAPTFKPGPDQGAPGLIVLLSTTPNMAGTPFAGPRTNLAGLFQINGVARTTRGTIETWNTWQPGKPLFGTGYVTLTAFAVKGTAPAIVPSTGLNKISNVVHVKFRIGA